MKNIILSKIRSAVKTVEPNAKIFLFGSRARGDSKNTSDWDLLVLLDGLVNSARVDTVRHKLYEVEWETGQIISSIVRNQRQWNSPIHRCVPIYSNIKREGIAL
jgi:uncharacterized protein